MIQQSDPLSALRDIHLPEPVSMWPPAAGWWAVLGLAVVVAAGSWLVVRRRRRSLRAAAMRELAAVTERYASSRDGSELAFELSELLRRVALARFPRRDVASLHGPQWVEFFERTAREPEIAASASAELETALYAPPSSVAPGDGERWIGAARSWIGGIA